MRKECRWCGYERKPVFTIQSLISYALYDADNQWVDNIRDKKETFHFCCKDCYDRFLYYL